MASVGWFKRWSRDFRLERYLRRHGGKFDYHGIAVTVPESVPFAIKKKLMRGEYEEPERRLIELFLRDDLPVVELGGSLGIVSAYVNRRLDPNLKFVIVEANPAILELCRLNASSAGSGRRIEVVHAACAYHVREIAFLVSDNVHGNRIAEAGSGECAVVPALTLRDLVETRLGLREFTLIMDIEGAEWDVFENDQDIFRQCAVVIVEIHPEILAGRGRSEAAFMRMVTAAGFDLAGKIGNSHAFLRRAT